MSFALEFQQVSRMFGSRHALQGLSFQVPERSVAAFVGANGAGKTTTFSIVGEFIRAHAGNVLVRGVPLRTYRADGQLIGLLPQDVQFFEHRTVARQLFLFAALSGLRRDQAWDEVDRVLTLASLGERAHDRVEVLSHGMRVRLAMAQAFIASPPLILLDEPTAGLDPLMVQEFRSLIQKVRGTTTIVISSHDLAGLQQICDYVVMIDKGKLVRQGSMATVVSGGRSVRYRLAALPGSYVELQKLLPGYLVGTEGSDLVVTAGAGVLLKLGEVNQLVLPWLLRERLEILEVLGGGKLEDAFVSALQ